MNALDILSERNYKDLLSGCRLCPRRCGADRLAGVRGACHETANVVAARAALHMWEEPCISGENGSGAVFFSGCSLGCAYCQNREIAEGKTGKKITTKRLAEIFFELKQQGANNINLVTPDHFLPQIIASISAARADGFDLPFVYNCSGYETAEAIRRLDGWIDIYVPDFKYMDPALAARYSGAPDYPEQAKTAVAEMVRQTGGEKTAFDENGMMQKGVIVRHLALPSCTEDSKAVIRYLYETYGNDIYISILNQYTPMSGVGRRFPELDRKLMTAEYDALVDYAVALGVENGFIQEGDTASESFIPPFTCEGV